MRATGSSSRAIVRAARPRRQLALLAALMLAVAGSPWLAAAQSDQVRPETEIAQVESAVVQEVAAEGTADFWVMFEDEADLSAAYGIEDWAERGQHVYDQLTKTAQASQDAFVDELASRDVGYEAFHIVNAVLVRSGDQRTLEWARTRDEVDRIAAQWEVEVPDLDPQEERSRVQALEWNVERIRADQVWEDFGVRGAGVVVANIDTGVQFDHPALVNQYRGNLGGGEFDHDYNWWDPSQVCGEPSLEPCDNHGHGTHTMGTIAGEDADSGNQIGVAPEARWIAAKGCESSTCSAEALLSSGEFMLAPTNLEGEHPRPELRPHVINNSWGGGGGDEWYREIVRAWTAAGIFPVFANGNDGPGCGTVGAPGSYPESYGVGAFDSNNEIASFSSRGPSPIAVGVKPDISAPGVDVRSSLPGDGYGANSGTSMATPHVTGAVALVIAAAPAMAGDIDGLRGLLDQSAIPTEDRTCGGEPDRNNVWGHGRLDALASVELAPRGLAGTLSGTVADAFSGDPLAGAMVTIDVDGRPRSTRTGPDGTYTIVLSEDTYDVTAGAIGYRPASGTAEIVEGQTTTGDFDLVALPALSGTVTNINDDGPIVGAKVTAISGDETRTTTTGEDGSYRLFLDIGTWEVTFEANNHISEIREIQANEDGQRIQVDVALTPLPSVSGTVSDANDGDAVTGATVTATSGDDSRTATTDEDGTYLLFLDLGTWEVTFEANNYITETRQVDIGENGQEVALDIELRTAVAALDMDEIDTVVLAGSKRTIDLTLTNIGSADLTWDAHEFSDGRSRPATKPGPDAGEVLTSWRATGAPEGPLGVGFNGNVWASDPGVTTGEQTNTEYAIDGTPTGIQHHPAWVGDRHWLRDMAYDPVRGWMCQARSGIGTGADIYCWDPATGDVTGVLTGSPWGDAYGGASVQGLAYNPVDDTFYAGIPAVGNSTNPARGSIHRVAGFSHPTPGKTITECRPEANRIAGLAYNNTADVLWMTTQGEYAAIYQLDPEDCSIISSLEVPDPTGTVDGLSIDESGNLWVASNRGRPGFMYLVDSGVPGEPDVPWLDVSATSGTLTPDERQDIEITLDTAGLEPGVHKAIVVLGTNAGREPRVTVPIRLVVTDYRQGVNAGGDAYTDTNQGEWAADQAFDGSWGYEYISSGVRGPRRPIEGTDDDPLYQAQRLGSLVGYRFDDVPDGVHEVEVHFADLHNRRPGQHVFDVTSDGVPLLLGCDIADEAGYRTAVIKRFYLEPTNETLRISFTRQTARATVAAVRVTHRPDLAEIPAGTNGSARAPTRTCATVVTDGVDSGMPNRATNAVTPQ